MTFEPDDPAVPDQVVVDAADSESGVAGGTLAMAPAGTDDWTSLPTSFDGHHLIATIDDAGLSGNYVLRATSCDNAGNCASTDETLHMPLRLAATAAVGFTDIEAPAKVVTERVLVGWTVRRVRRGGKVQSLRIGGHYATVRLVIPANTTCAHKRIRTGPHSWRELTACRTLNVRTLTSEYVPYGRSVTVHGLLVSGQGVPIANTAVGVYTAPDNGLGQFTPLTTVTTNSDGQWTATLPPGPSRIIEAWYGGSAATLPAVSQATVKVPATVRIHITPTIVPWGSHILITGRVLGGDIPPGSNILKLEFGDGPRPHTIGTPNIAPNGTFSIPVTWSTGRGVVNYWFAVATLSEADYPFTPGTSSRVRVTVGKATPYHCCRSG